MSAENQSVPLNLLLSPELNERFYRSHAPAWECSLYRSCGSIPPTLERRRWHSHTERGNDTKMMY